MMTNDDFYREACGLLVHEKLEHMTCKKYSVVLFTANKVIKFFSMSSPDIEKSIRYEYEWNQKNSLLNPVLDRFSFGGTDNTIMIMNRLPRESNLEHILVNGKMEDIDLDKLLGHIRKCYTQYDFVNASTDVLYENYANNIKKQIARLSNAIPQAIVSDILYIVKSVKFLFEYSHRHKRVYRMHGNLFSSNVYLVGNEIIFLDPFPFDNVAISDKISDSATLQVDFLLIPRKEVDLSGSLFFTDIEEELLFLIHLMLKVLVRIRFSLMENQMYNGYSTYNVNQIILTNSSSFSKLRHIVDDIKRKIKLIGVS